MVRSFQRVNSFQLTVRRKELEQDRSFYKSGSPAADPRLFQRLNAYFLEKDDVVVAVILQADIALVGARAMLRLEIEFALRNGLAFGVVGDRDVVKDDDGVRTIERDDHGIPLWTGFTRLGERLGQRIKRASDVIVVFIGRFGVVVNLDFVAVVDRHPLLARFEGNANENAGIIIEVAHLVDHADAAIGELAA